MYADRPQRATRLTRGWALSLAAILVTGCTKSSHSDAEAQTKTPEELADVVEGTANAALPTLADLPAPGGHFMAFGATLCDLVRESDLVVVGQVAGIAPLDDPNYVPASSVVTVTVHSTLVGDAQEGARVIVSGRTETGPTLPYSPLLTPFVVNERVVLFLVEAPKAPGYYELKFLSEGKAHVDTGGAVTIEATDAPATEALLIARVNTLATIPGSCREPRRPVPEERGTPDVLESPPPIDAGR